MKKSSRSRIIPIQPVAMQTGTATPADDAFSLHPKQDKIYSRAVGGLFARLRWVMTGRQNPLPEPVADDWRCQRRHGLQMEIEPAKLQSPAGSGL
jgi:hypothetical protein